MPVTSEALVDANILLRLLTNEPGDLAERAAELLEAAEQAAMALVVASFTIAEVVYVLSSVYRWERSAIAERLLELLAASVVTVLEEDAVRRALVWFRDTRAVSFADAYLCAIAVERGHGQVMSFDRELRRIEGVAVIAEVADVRRGRGEAEVRM